MQRRPGTAAPCGGGSACPPPRRPPAAGPVRAPHAPFPPASHLDSSSPTSPSVSRSAQAHAAGERAAVPVENQGRRLRAGGAWPGAGAAPPAGPRRRLPPCSHSTAAVHADALTPAAPYPAPHCRRRRLTRMIQAMRRASGRSTRLWWRPYWSRARWRCGTSRWKQPLGGEPADPTVHCTLLACRAADAWPAGARGALWRRCLLAFLGRPPAHPQTPTRFTRLPPPSNPCSPAPTAAAWRPASGWI